MLAQIPKPTIGDLIDKYGKGSVVMAMDGAYPDPDAFMMITRRAAREMVAKMEASLQEDIEDLTTGNVDIYDHPESTLH